MNAHKVLELFDIAQKTGYAVKLKLTGNQSMILLPSMGAIETVEIEGKEFLKLKKSLLPVSDIERAILYGGDSSAE